MNFAPPLIMQDVLQFIALSQPEMVCTPNEPPKPETLALAKVLIEGEVVKELLPTLEKLTKAGYSLELSAQLLDDIVDSIYVLTWTAITLQLPLHPAWHAVQSANMAKFPIHNPNVCGGAKCDHNYMNVIEVEGREITYREICSYGRLIRRNIQTGKVVKPEGWKEPDIHTLLYEIWKEIKLKQNPEIIATSTVKEKYYGSSEHVRNILIDAPGDPNG